jgi:hypothetical protein
LLGAYNAAAAAVIASWGGPDVWADQEVIRAFIRGPSGSTCDLYLGPETPQQMAGLAQREADYSLTGSKDYGSWQPPLALPAGWFIAFVWTGGSTAPGSTGTVRLEYDTAAGGW